MSQWVERSVGLDITNLDSMVEVIRASNLLDERLALAGLQTRLEASTKPPTGPDSSPEAGSGPALEASE